jgi:hypothetical protein
MTNVRLVADIVLMSGVVSACYTVVLKEDGSRMPRVNEGTPGVGTKIYFKLKILSVCVKKIANAAFKPFCMYNVVFYSWWFMHQSFLLDAYQIF